MNESSNTSGASSLQHSRGSCEHMIQVARDSINFASVPISDPVPTGRQIAIAAGLDDRSDFSLFAILPSGDLEDVRLNETFDVRARAVERFVVIEGDRVFRFRLNQRQLAWGQHIRGDELHYLAGGRDDEAVFLDVRGGTDRQIAPDEVVDLGQPGVERFITAVPQPTEFEITINARAHTLQSSTLTFERVIQLAFPNSTIPPNAYAMTFECAASHPSAGDLTPGKSIHVKTGTQINVTPTNQS